MTAFTGLCGKIGLQAISFSGPSSEDSVKDTDGMAVLFLPSTPSCGDAGK